MRSQGYDRGYDRLTLRPGGLVARGTAAAPAAVVCFLEGPAVDAAGNVFFSDIAGNRILKMDAKGAVLATNFGGFD